MGSVNDGHFPGEARGIGLAISKQFSAFGNPRRVRIGTLDA
jgi:hypothetical protein